MKKYLLVLLTLILVSALGHAQGVPYIFDPTQAHDGSLRVCSYPPVNDPCTNTVTLYSDAALTTVINYPIQLRVGYEFFVNPGTYTMDIVGANRIRRAIQMGAGGQIPVYTVAALPTSVPKGWIATVSDGASSTDCIAGAGSTVATCRWNGSAWEGIGGGGGGSGTVTNSGALTANKCVVGGGTTVVTVDSSCSVSSGVITASGFSGAGTNLTGTAASLNIGGNAATATSATTATNANNSAITDDTTGATTVYPAWSNAASGNNALKVTSTKLSFVPSTGVLSSTGFAGAGTGLTGTASGLSIGGNAATATSASAVPWSGVSSTPTTLSGYGITNGVATSTTVAGHALSSNVTVACGDLSDSSGGCTMSTTAGGDLSGTLPSPTVAKVNGKTATWTSAAAEDRVKFSDANTLVNYESGITTNAQTGTTYAPTCDTIKGQFVTFANGSAVTFTVPDASDAVTAKCDALTYFWTRNKNASGGTTVTANRSGSNTINGATSFLMLPETSCLWKGDGTNWEVDCGIATTASTGALDNHAIPGAGKFQTFVTEATPTAFNTSGTAVNTLSGRAFYVPYNLSGITRFEFNVATADGTNSDGICLYDMTGAKIIAVAPATHSSTGTVGVTISSTNIPQGWYVIAIAFNASSATMRLGSNATLGSYRMPFSSASFGTVSSGTCPNSITAPTVSWTNLAVPFADFTAE